jgi:putative membrane protein
MIVRPRPRAWELFTIMRLSIVPSIAPQLLVITLFSVAVTWAGHRYPAAFRTFSVAPFTLMGTALSIFLGFRNNASYDRWWEARRQLGALIGEARSLARLAMTMPGGDRKRRERMVRRVIGYVYALMAHLRGEQMPEEAQRYTSGWTELRTAHNVPDALLRGVAEEFGAMLAEGEIGEPVYQRFDDRASAMAAIQVACERILGTPMPFTYTLLLHRTAYAFCFLLPFGLVGTLGYATPVLCAVIAYAFFGLDELGNELEEPFGAWLNALPLNAMARTVEISLLEAMGEENVPEMMSPVDSILR